MRLAGETTLKIDKKEADVLAPATGGRLRYRWRVGDTDTVGKFEAEFEITFPTLTSPPPGGGPTSEILTAPDRSYIIIEIVEDVA